MAVYTSITKEELKTFLSDFDVGALQSFDGISSGVTNTNYLVTTSLNKYILTVFRHCINFTINVYYHSLHVCVCV